LAYHEPGPDTRGGRYLGPDGREVALWRTEGIGTLLRFRSAVQEQPFVKMGLLAAVLARTVASQGR
jgi:hypothetical protein